MRYVAVYLGVGAYLGHYGTYTSHYYYTICNEKYFSEGHFSEGSTTKEISYTFLRNQQKSTEINQEITRNHPMKSLVVTGPPTFAY